MLLTSESRGCTDVYLTEPTSVKKIRSNSTSSTDTIIPESIPSPTSTIRNLELDSVKEIFQGYDLLNTSGEVSCVVCGKSYKSKVCVKKHLWEHSIYWDLFDGLKKQQRVLSIQAALILSIKFNPSLSLLLVTQSSNNVKKNKSADKSDCNALHTQSSNNVKKNKSVDKSDSNTNINRPIQNVNKESVENKDNTSNIIPSRKRKLDTVMMEDKKAFKCYSLQRITSNIATATLEVLPPKH